MKKIIISVIALFLVSLNVNAKGIKNIIGSTISNSGIEKSTISMSVKNADTGKVVYELNSKTLMHPASVQKLLTLPAALDVLGEDYEFTTSLYSRGDNAYILKLGADPYLKSSDLKTLVKEINKATVKQIYLDDSIIESKDWGEGWQWDDDLNTSMTRFNSYNLDRNILKITVMPTQPETRATIINPSKFPFVFINNVYTGSENNVKLTRDSSIASNALTLEGTVKSPVILYVPMNNLKQYFNFKLTSALSDRNIYLKTSFVQSKLDQKDKEILKINHPISQAIYDILKNSNNAVAETVVKIWQNWNRHRWY